MESPLIYNTQNLQSNLDDLSNIYHVVGKYYQGVEEANPTLLDDVFHETWFMRDDDIRDRAYLYVEDKNAFIKRVSDHGSYKGYAHFRDFANVDVLYHNLAFVRINKDPSRNSTCFFLFKLNTEWIIMDKVWVNPRDEHTQATPSQNHYASIESILQNYYQTLSTSNHENTSI